MVWACVGSPGAESFVETVWIRADNDPDEATRPSIEVVSKL